MPKLVFAVACQRAITDTNGLLSMIDVIEQIELAGTVNPDDTLDRDVTFVTHWVKEANEEPQEHRLRVCVYSPDGACQLERVGQPFQIAGAQQSHRYLFHLRNLPVGMPGRWLIQVSIRDAAADTPWATAAEYPITVSHAPAADTSGPSR